MPGFVKTKNDEKKWDRAKEIASGRGLPSGTQSFYKFATYLYHKKMKKEHSIVDSGSNPYPKPSLRKGQKKHGPA